MTPTNDEKKQVWAAYRARKPIRVPVTFGVNPRVVLFDPDWNPGGITFEEYFTDARALVEVQLKFLEYQVAYLNRYSDSPTGWPESFDLYVDVQNIYDSAYFGAPVEMRDGQVADAAPVLAGADRDRIFSVDVDHPMDNPFVRRCLERHAELTEVVARTSFHGVRLGVRPVTWGFDGPLTIATNLRGGELYTDLYERPDYADRLMDFITRGVIIRNRAMSEHFGLKAFKGASGGIADDSVQLISTPMYRERVMPLHRLYLSQWSVEGPHSIHLCGDATRHFPDHPRRAARHVLRHRLPRRPRRPAPGTGAGRGDTGRPGGAAAAGRHGRGGLRPHARHPALRRHGRRPLRPARGQQPAPRLPRGQPVGHVPRLPGARHLRGGRLFVVRSVAGAGRGPLGQMVQQRHAEHVGDAPGVPPDPFRCRSGLQEGHPLPVLPAHD